MKKYIKIEPKRVFDEIKNGERYIYLIDRQLAETTSAIERVTDLRIGEVVDLIRDVEDDAYNRFEFFKIEEV